MAAFLELYVKCPGFYVNGKGKKEKRVNFVVRKNQNQNQNQKSESKAIKILAVTPGFLAALHPGAVAGVHEFL